eukprot:13978771-Alexandrium_andersonii.AAC.2
MAAIGPLKEFMLKKKVTGDIKTFFREMRQEGIKELAEHTPVFQATLGPSDFLFTPSHMVSLESMMADDTVGLRALCVLKRDKPGMKIYADISKEAATAANDVSKFVDALATPS